MESNVGGADRAIRLLIGIVLIPFGIFGPLEGAVKIAVIIIGIIGLGTGLLTWCPINQLLGLNTCKR